MMCSLMLSKGEVGHCLVGCCCRLASGGVRICCLLLCCRCVDWCLVVVDCVVVVRVPCGLK